MDGEERFAALVETFAGTPGVTLPEDGGRRFGASALKVDGSIFAMLVQGELVLKLPRERVAAMIESGAGGPFSSGKGTPMREWVTVIAPPDGDQALAREALEFVRSQHR